MFQSLIGWLQTLQKELTVLNPYEFQSLIGWLQTFLRVRPDISNSSVSIPYRLATNKSVEEVWKESALWFQSLIGWLQTH